MTESLSLGLVRKLANEQGVMLHNKDHYSLLPKMSWDPRTASFHIKQEFPPSWRCLHELLLLENPSWKGLSSQTDLALNPGSVMDDGRFLTREYQRPHVSVLNGLPLGSPCALPCMLTEKGIS